MFVGAPSFGENPQVPAIDTDSSPLGNTGHVEPGSMVGATAGLSAPPIPRSTPVGFPSLVPLGPAAPTDGVPPMPVPFPVDSPPVPELGLPSIAATSGADGEEPQATTQAPSSRPGNVNVARLVSHLRGLMRPASRACLGVESIIATVNCLGFTINNDDDSRCAWLCSKRVDALRCAYSPLPN
jgi:hypothetical protein